MSIKKEKYFCIKYFILFPLRAVEAGGHRRLRRRLAHLLQQRPVPENRGGRPR